MFVLLMASMVSVLMLNAVAIAASSENQTSDSTITPMISFDGLSTS